jgi:hypothetical protein
MKSRAGRQANAPHGCHSWQSIRFILFMVAGLSAARDTRRHEK